MEPKALYHDGIDTRMNMYEFDILPPEKKNDSYPDLEQIKTNALAVACLMPKWALIKTPQK